MAQSLQVSMDFGVARDLSQHSPVPSEGGGAGRSMRPEWLEVRDASISLKSMSQVPGSCRRTIVAVDRRIKSDLPTHVERILKDFWLRRYRQYTSNEAFISRIAKTMNLSEPRIREMQAYLGLPDVAGREGGASKMGIEERFTSCVFVNSVGVLADPLESLYNLFLRNNEYRESWQIHYERGGYLEPEAINPDDLSFVLKTYVLPPRLVAEIFQVKAGMLADYLDTFKTPLHRHSSAVHLGALFTNGRHNRLMKIAMHYAQMVYKHQGVPMSIIAGRLGIDATMLYDLAETHIGDWCQPTCDTIRHVVEHVTLTHIERYKTK